MMSGITTGRESSLSCTGRSSSTTLTTPVKKTYKYRKVANESQVDETLFKTSAVKLTPKSECTANGENVRSSSKTKSPAIKAPLTGMPRTRNQYRIVKHSASYVDESLFGPPLPVPTFPAPWEKKETCVKGQTLTWSPPVAGSMSMKQTTPRGATSGSFAGSRPFSAGATRPGSAGAKRPNSAGAARPSSAGPARPSSAGGNLTTKQPWR